MQDQLQSTSINRNMQTSTEQQLDSFVSEIKNKLASLHKEWSYPLIVFPSSLSSFLKEPINEESFIDFCREMKGDLDCLRPLTHPYKPIVPVLHTIPSSHREFVKESLWKSDYWQIIIGFFVFGLLLCFIGFIKGGVSSFLFFMFFWALLTIVLIVFLVLQGDKNRNMVYKEIPYSKKQFDTLKDEEQRRYEAAVKEYPNALKKYEEDLEFFNKAMAERERIIKSCIPMYLSSLVKTNFVKSMAYSTVNDAPIRGRSEDLLFAELMKHVPDAVHVDTVISGYYPDIMISTPSGVYIDVEIDEPYEMNSKKEIHCIGGDDDTRNARIAQKEWIVLRFSEKQVMTNCASCTRIIEDLIAIVENGDLQALDELTTMLSLVSDKRWTKEVARMMALENYRESYCSHPLKVSHLGL